MAADPDAAVRSDGYLRPDVLDPSWAVSEPRFRSVAAALTELAARQEQALRELGPRAVAAAYSESAAAVLCLELERDGLPVDRRAAEELIAASAGPRPDDEKEAGRIRRERDARVLAHAPGREGTDLRNPAQVKDLLAAAGVSVPNTRKFVLEPFRQANPLVDALLEWRKDERIATTYGYRWLDEHVGPDGRLRGGWTACDGAAGRMTAQNGLHNLPAPLRPAVVAEPGHVFVRADLGQIEPRVLAVVSGDRAFAEATRADDLYAPVAAKLGIERKVAKVAVLAAMYGQRSGAAGRALGDLERAYPVAMGLLDEAYASGVARRPLRTFGGRRINLDAAWAGSDDGGRGRFARNAVIQGSAAELFKAWAATVRHVTAPMGAQIVLCLHDELLLQAPEDRAAEVADARGPLPGRQRPTMGGHRGRPVRRRHQRHQTLVRRQVGRSGGAETAAVLVLALVALVALVVLDDVLEERLELGADLVGRRQLGHAGGQQAGPLATLHERVVLALQRLHDGLDLVGPLDLASDLGAVQARRGGEVGHRQAEAGHPAHRARGRRARRPRTRPARGSAARAPRTRGRRGRTPRAAAPAGPTSWPAPARCRTPGRAG